MGASEPIDRLLEDAGSRWRTGQPESRTVSASLFSSDRAPRWELGGGRALSFFAGAASTAAVVVAVAVAAPGLMTSLGGGSSAPNPSTGYLATGIDNCPTTKASDGRYPDPSVTGGVVPGYGAEWYGTNDLYTQVGTVSTIWVGLPKTDRGYPQKTFWWRDGYLPSREPNPQIFVTGKRLDGPGTFGFGPGTNAAAEDLGKAMLVGVDVPSLGCWEVTGTYYEHTLTYVVWVGEVSP